MASMDKECANLMERFVRLYYFKPIEESAMAFRGTGGIPSVEPAQRMRDERAEALAELLNSDGWLRVAVPSLQRRRAALERRIAGALSDDIHFIRALQGEWATLDSLLRDAKSFLDVEER